MRNNLEDKSESQEDAITTDSEIKIDLTKEKPEIKHKSNTDGGEGSGNYGHKGRKGSVGGSAKSSASTSKGTEQKQKKKTVTTNETKSEEGGKSVDKSAKSDIIEQEKLRAELKAKIEKGDYVIKLNANKQNNHTYAYYISHKTTKSYFLDEFTDLSKSKKNEICRNAIETGRIIKYTDNEDNISYRVAFRYDSLVGVVINENIEIPSCFIGIHFSKKGYHFVPYDGLDRKEQKDEKN